MHFGLGEQHALHALLPLASTHTQGHFSRHCRPPHRCFTPAELNTLVAGEPTICAEEWEAHAAHSHCSAATPQAAWFWEAVRAMGQTQRAALLGFVTGSTALPAGGLH